uniref:C-type lectin domain family 2 member B n=1 Tax=Aotus nancymaae TaxID=37293 RepID=A0A2K5CY16_AOTNA
VISRHKKCFIMGAILIIISNAITVLIGKLHSIFYFSGYSMYWNSSRYNCSTQHADLTKIDSKEEMDFLRWHKCSSDHWIGFVMKGSEECTYLSDDGTATARCYTERKWICRKKIH